MTVRPEYVFVLRSSTICRKIAAAILVPSSYGRAWRIAIRNSSILVEICCQAGQFSGQSGPLGSSKQFNSILLTAFSIPVAELFADTAAPSVTALSSNVDKFDVPVSTCPRVPLSCFDIGSTAWSPAGCLGQASTQLAGKAKFKFSPSTRPKLVTPTRRPSWSKSPPPLEPGETGAVVWIT